MDEFEANYYSFFLTFYKVGEDNKILKNESYEIYSIDDVPTGIVLQKTENGRFLYDNTNYDSENKDAITKTLIPNVAKEKIASLSNMEEVRALANYGDFITTNDWTVLRKLYISFDIPIKLKQIVVEDGYKPRDIIIRGIVNFDFDYGTDLNTIIRKRVSLSSQQFRKFEIAREPVAINSFEDLENIQYITLDSEDEELFSCINENAGMIITEQDDCTEYDYAFSAGYNLVPYFMAEKGTVSFAIDNTVNGVTKYNASKEKKLEYKITVKNTGDVSSSNNEITTYVPSEIKINEQDINSNGEYNKNDNTISWNIERIEADETIILTYTATAPENVNGKELIGYSTVRSTQVAGVTQSTNTIVTLDKIVEVIKNPETSTMVYLANTNIGLPLSYLIILILLICLVTLTLVKKLKKIK